MKEYRGLRVEHQGMVQQVSVGVFNGDSHYDLDPRIDLVNHSPDGVEWGYLGSGPAQLALALLADHLQDDQAAIELHQDFKARVVAGLPHSGWTLTAQELEAAVQAARRGDIPY